MPPLPGQCETNDDGPVLGLKIMSRRKCHSLYSRVSNYQSITALTSNRICNGEPFTHVFNFAEPRVSDLTRGFRTIENVRSDQFVTLPFVH